MLAGTASTPLKVSHEAGDGKASLDHAVIGDRGMSKDVMPRSLFKDV